MKFLIVVKEYILLKLALWRAKKYNIVVGSSRVFEPGWIPTDLHTLNLLKPGRWKFFVRPNSVDAILAEHVWEHLSLEDGKQAAKTCYTYLKKGAHARIAVPDGLHPDKEYINYVKPGGTGPGADDHKVLYTYATFKQIFEEAGFRVQLLEYFDESGKFVYNEWNREEGFIHRSKRYDERNQGGELKYTSIILDAIKQ